MQKLDSCPEKQGLILMLGHRCKDCQALFVEMRSAVDDAKAIVTEAGVLIHANKPSEHLDGWCQIRDQWHGASLRWMLAAAEFKKHLATHQVAPASAKSVAKVSRCRQR